MFVNYIAENQARIEYAIDEGLSSSEWLLWEALYYLFNQRTKGSDWPDGFIRIPNKRLLSVIPVQYDAMAAARNKLKQRGVIDYVQGRKNTDPPMYRLNYLTVPQTYPDDAVDKHVDNFVDKSGYTEKPDNLPGNITGNLPGNITGNLPDKTANIYPNVTQKNVSKPDVEEEEEERARAGTADQHPPADADAPDTLPSDAARKTNMAKVLNTAYVMNFGRHGAPGCINRVALMLDSLGFTSEMATLLIEQAALYQAKDLFAFSTKVLQDWVDDDIRTPEEFSERRLLLDLQSGRIDGIRHNTTDELDRLRKKRREDHRNV